MEKESCHTEKRMEEAAAIKWRVADPLGVMCPAAKNYRGW